jgi:pSer/pThr/pTyr-binding forkhead associated (FHA) protein
VVQLQILNGAKAGTRWVAGRLPFTIGRAADDTFRIEEPGVWEHHCRIELRSDFHAALVATPGPLTVVNGEPITEASLRNGDQIELGGQRLQFGLSPTAHRSLRLREGITWFGFALLALAQVALVYLLMVDL